MTLLIFSPVVMPEKPPRLYEFAISLDEGAFYAQELQTLFLQLIFHDLEAGDVLLLVDPIRRERICLLEIDHKLAGKPPHLRKKLLPKLHGKELQQIGVFFTALQQKVPSDGPTEPESLFGYLRSAALLRHEFPNHRKHLIFLGNFITPHENPLFSLVDRVPSLSHLQSSESVFGTVGEEKLLTDMAVHVILSPDWREFSPHQIERHHSLLKDFVAAWIDQTGGELHSFAGHIHHLLGLPTGNFVPILPLEQVTDQPLQSMVFQPMTVTEETYTTETGEEKTFTAVEMEQALYQDVSNSTQPPPINLDDPEVDTVGFLSIGVRWQEPIDIDLYVQVGNDDELSFRKGQSSQYHGIHIRDHTRSPEQNGFETILYQEIPVDLRDIKPIFLNHYGGTARNTPFVVELRVMFKGQLYWKKFQMQSKHGNRSSGSRYNSPHWLAVNIRELVQRNPQTVNR
jgi:hypothetical protein